VSISPEELGYPSRRGGINAVNWDIKKLDRRHGGDLYLCICISAQRKISKAPTKSQKNQGRIKRHWPKRMFLQILVHICISE